MTGFWVDAAVNSALIVAGVSALSLVIAVPAAWLIARTDLPGAAFLHRVFTLSYALPSYLLAIAWELATPDQAKFGLLVVVPGQIAHQPRHIDGMNGPLVDPSANRSPFRPRTATVSLR